MTAVGHLPEPMAMTRVATWPLVREQVRTLSPAYFAMVMATGIVAIAAHLTGMFLVGRVLAVISLIAYVVLVAMTLPELHYSRGRSSKT